MTDTEQTDEQIAAKVQSGDTEAFALLVERYRAKLARYGHKFLSDDDDAEDVVQEVFIKAYENIQSFDAARRFSPWIYRIAHNEFVNTLKKRSRGPVFGIDLDVVFPHLAAAETADDRANEKEMQRLIDACLSELDPKYREALVLYYYEGMGYKDMADVLQIPVSTAGVRLSRGKAALQKIAAQKHLYE